MKKKLIRERIIKHLADYKIKILKIDKNGIWRKKKYPHILPKEDWKKNIIPQTEYDQKIISEIKNKNIKLHQGFHHLTSSQALCFNLFYPIFFAEKFDLLLDKKLHKDYIFEYIKDENENTNFDLYVETNQAKYYFEIKYTENEFGKAKNDKRHEDKYEKIYKDKLKKFTGVTMEIFFRYYQLFRNLIYDDGYNIFVFPKDRSDLKDTIKYVIENHCKEQEEHIIILPIEEIVEIMLGSSDNKLIKHYELFRKKYLLY